MSDDALNPKNLDICKQHIVFQHFPMQRLVENPGVWSVINYKYGQLIAMDLNTIDWIYVIKSGEARVLKYLQPGKIDVKARRRKVQAMVNSQSPFYRKKRILKFVEEREYIKSAYRPSNYHPPVGERHTARSAPPASSRRQKTPTSLLPHRACVSLPSTRQGPRDASSRKTSSAFPGKNSPRWAKPEVSLPRLVLDDNPITDAARNGDSDGKTVVVVETVEELPGDVTSRPNQKNSLEEKLPPPMGGEDSGHLKAREDGDGGGGGGGDGGGGGGSGDGEGGSRSRRGSLLSIDGSRERRASIVSVDGSRRALDPEASRRRSKELAGGLFDKPRVPGQRRQSILVPPEGKPEGAERESRPILLMPSADVKSGCAPPGADRMRVRSGSFLKTPQPGTTRSLSPNTRSESRGQVIQVGRHTLPAFVQVETLHPGQVFGLRACLDEEERGPSVSLVSGECEVLQINKKFFMRHCDDAIYSLIRLKNKPFPSEEDLIDRLDINMQWEEYKQHTLNTFLQECRRSKR